MGLSVPCLLVFGRHSFVNLSSEFRELVLGSERQVFVERAPGTKYWMRCVRRELPGSCAHQGVLPALCLQSECVKVEAGSLCQSGPPGGRGGVPDSPGHGPAKRALVAVQRRDTSWEPGIPPKWRLQECRDPSHQGQASVPTVIMATAPCECSYCQARVPGGSVGDPRTAQ